MQFIIIVVQLRMCGEPLDCNVPVETLKMNYLFVDVSHDSYAQVTF